MTQTDYHSLTNSSRHKHDESTEEDKDVGFHVFLENLIQDLGGFGRYQILLCSIVHGTRLISAWSMIQMTFVGAIPDWWCLEDLNGQNGTEGDIRDNVTNKECPEENSTCDISFDDSMHTVVDEFQLVCDNAWAVALITTLQFVGVLVGNFAAGQLADTYGRKPTFFISLLIMVVGNVVAFFSTKWQMYAAVRVFIGIGIGSYITVQLSLMFEFITSKWRPVMASIPSWPLFSGLFALACFLLRDWKWAHIATAVTGVPFLFTWRFVPESFRWLITKEKYESAEDIVKAIAKANGKPVPNLQEIREKAKRSMLDRDDDTGNKRYFVTDLFRSFEIAKTTICLFLVWISVGYGYYAITFGVQALSGDLYLNMFLVSVIEAPGMLTLIYFTNCIGRKKSAIMFFFLAGVSGVIVGSVRYVESELKGTLTNVFALASKLGISCGWTCLQIMTTEVYPTVVRSIALGLNNSAARIGAMVAPQMVFLNDDVPGLLFFLCGGLMLMSTFLTCTFPETKGLALTDRLNIEREIIISKENDSDPEKERLLRGQSSTTM